MNIHPFIEYGLLCFFIGIFWAILDAVTGNSTAYETNVMIAALALQWAIDKERTANAQKPTNGNN